MLKFFNGFLVLSSGAMIIQNQVSKYRKYFPYEYFLSFRRFFFYSIDSNKNKRNLFHSGEGFLRLLCKKFTATMSWLDGINFSALLARTTRRVMKMLIHKCLKRLPGRIRRMLTSFDYPRARWMFHAREFTPRSGFNCHYKIENYLCKRWYSKNFSTKTKKYKNSKILTMLRNCVE